MKEYASCVAKNALDEETFNKTRIIVVPAIGKIGDFNYGEVELKERELPSHLYAYVVETLPVRELYEELNGVTHGVNYLPNSFVRPRI